MFVHEYSDKQFKTFEECVEDLREQIDIEDIVQHMDLTLSDVVNKFLHNGNNADFSAWFQQQIDEAITQAEDEFVTEYEEEEGEEDE